MMQRDKTVLFITLLIASLFASDATGQSDTLVAFPGAEGFGRFATGGRGGDVYHVTNLTDFGVGSLRYGIQSANGPRTIVFDVSGNIMLNGGLKIEKSNITIAGQTAPGDGITIGGNDLTVTASNLIIRYIRVRLGDQSGADDDAVSINRGSNIIFDHVTASWSIDETFSCQSDEVDSLTVQWCMVTESLRDSHHEKGAHGYGGIIGSQRQSFHHNLYAHHSSRSPKVTWRQHCKVDFRNNVIYNWGNNNCYDGSSCHMNWVNNYYKSGPATSSGVRDRIFQLNDVDTSSSYLDGVPYYQLFTTALYADGNYIEGFPAITADNWKGGIDYSGDANEQEHRAHTPFNFPSITEQTPQEVYPLVVAGAGASLVRDIIDKRIASEVLSGTTTYSGSKTGAPGLIDSQNDVGGWPVLNTLPPLPDSDRDGMSDKWEADNGLNPDDPEDRNGIIDPLAPYTNLERYLEFIIQNGATSVETRAESGNLNGYPNPCNDYFYLSYDIAYKESLDVQIFGLDGYLIEEISGITPINNALKIDMHRYYPGLYFVNIVDKEGNQRSMKVIKD